MGKLLKWLGVAVIGFGIWWFWPAESDGAEKTLHDVRVSVIRKDLTLKIIENGHAEASTYTTVRIPVHRNLKLISILPEGARVTKDQIVARFSDDNLESAIEIRGESIDANQKNIQLYLSQLELQKVMIQSSIDDRLDAVRKAETNLVKYMEIEAPKAKKEKSINLNRAEQTLKDAEKKLSDVIEKHDKEIFVEEKIAIGQQQELANVRRQVESAKKALDVAYLDIKLYNNHTYPENLSTRHTAMKKAKIAFEQAKLKAQSDIIGLENKKKHERKRLKNNEKSMENLLKARDSLEMKSPTNGIIVYGDPANPWSKNHIREGNQFYFNTPVFTVPDTGEYNVKLLIDEEYRSQLKKGVTVLTTFPAVPDMSISGKIIEIDNIAKPRFQGQEDSPRAYQIKILLDEAPENLSQGMTARAEIITGKLKDVLVLPIEAVTFEEGKAYVDIESLTGPGRREVETGDVTDSEIVILSGLEEGETVVITSADDKSGNSIEP